MTFIEILRQVADELGLPRPTSATSSDPSTRQLVALANRDGQQLMKEVDWTDLQTEYIIEFVTPLSLTGDIAEGSKIITNINTTGLQADAFAISGGGIQVAARVMTIDSPTQLTMSESANLTMPLAELTITRDTFNIPEDFDRYIDQTMWDRRFQWALIGPNSPQFDQWMRSGIVTVGPRRRWRQVGKKPTAFRVFPPPAAEGNFPGTLVWEYISNGWVKKANGIYANRLAADDDEPIFPDGLLDLGLKWRYFQIKGMAYADLQQEALDWVNREKSRDGGMPTLPLNQSQPGYLISPSQVQDGSFPGPGNQ